MIIIPAVDVLDGSVVRLRQGDFGRVTDYGSDPVGAAGRWVDEGASLVHIVDLDGARHGRPDVRLWKTLGEAGIPFQVGGGIRSVEQAAAALEVGALRVVLGSAAVWRPEVVSEAVRRLGGERVVVALDVAEGRATGSGWLDEGRSHTEVAADMSARGVEWMLVTSIARDGMMEGPDLALLAGVETAAPRVNIIASGGVGSLEDLLSLRDGGAAAAIVGRALYDGAFTLGQALSL